MRFIKEFIELFGWFHIIALSLLSIGIICAVYTGSSSVR